MDLLSILPDFPIEPYEHILFSLERSHVSTTDLLTLDALQIAKRAKVPVTDTRRFTEHVIRALHQDVGFEEQSQGQEGPLRGDADPDGGPTTPPNKPTSFGKLDVTQWSSISTLDPVLDDVLRGGIPTRYVTEITGESATGKSQFLLHLLLSVQLPPPVGLSKKALYISTESPLSTVRLQQLLESHPALTALPSDVTAPSLANIMSLNAIDLETQDHVINYQLPIAVAQNNIGLVIIDSVTSNYRGEYPLDGMSERSGELINLGRALRDLAVKEDLAVVVANQVLDRFEAEIDDFRLDQPTHLLPGSESPHSLPFVPNQSVESPSFSASANPSTPPNHDEPPLTTPATSTHSRLSNLLSINHQQRFFTGWGDTPPDSFLHSENSVGGLKNPALGLLWASQIACRVVLKKHMTSSDTPDPAIESTGQPSIPSVQPPQSQPSASALGEESEQGNITVSNSRPGDEESCKDNKPSMNEEEGTSDPLNNYPGNTREPELQERQRPTMRTMKVVFSPWTPGRRQEKEISGPDDDPERSREIEFEIWKGGIRGVE